MNYNKLGILSYNDKVAMASEFEQRRRGDIRIKVEKFLRENAKTINEHTASRTVYIGVLPEDVFFNNMEEFTSIVKEYLPDYQVAHTFDYVFGRHMIKISWL